MAPAVRVFPARPVQALATILSFTAALWVIEFYDQLTGEWLDADGIVPRSWDGLDGMLWAPLLHGGFGPPDRQHPAVPRLRVPGAGGRDRAVRGGHRDDLGARRPGRLAHRALRQRDVGMSGVIFGWLVFLLARGFFARSGRRSCWPSWCSSSGAGSCSVCCRASRASRGRGTCSERSPGCSPRGSSRGRRAATRQPSRIATTAARPRVARSRLGRVATRDRRADRHLRLRRRRAHRRPGGDRPAARRAGRLRRRHRARAVRPAARSPTSAGTRSPSATRWWSSGVKALVVACNTATAACLPDTRERYPVPVVEVVRPAVRRAVATTRSGRIGVIGTRATIASGAYQDAFAAAPGVEVTAVACPRFVDFVERGMTSGRQVLGLAQSYLEPLQRAHGRHARARLHALPAARRRAADRGRAGRHARLQRRGDREGRRAGAHGARPRPRPGRPAARAAPIPRDGDPEPFRRLGRRFLGPEIGSVAGLPGVDRAATPARCARARSR